MQNNSHINCKYYSINVTAPDGVVLEGEIQYWAKDYKISLFYPLKLQEYSGYLQYAIPKIFLDSMYDKINNLFSMHIKQHF